MASLVKNVLHDAHDQGTMISIELLGTRSRGQKRRKLAPVSWEGSFGKFSSRLRKETHSCLPLPIASFDLKDGRKQISLPLATSASAQPFEETAVLLSFLDWTGS